MLLSRGGGRRGAVLMQLAARDEQLLLEPLAHLFPYPAFCYLLSPCTADAEQRLTRGLQASHQPSPSLQPSSQPYPRP